MARTTQPLRLRQAITLLLLWLPFMPIHAQELEYRMEIGASAGATCYMGDANSVLFAHPSAMGGAVFRRVFNPHMALKANLAFANLRGNSQGEYIPYDATSGTAEGGQNTVVKFNRNVLDLGAQFELNLFGYGMGTDILEKSRIAPYLLAGIGATLAPGGAQTAFGFNIPIGFGVKYKIRPRLNIGLEWTMRFTTTDALDASKKEWKQLIEPYGIKSAGFKNKDCYSFTMVFLTYDISPKYRQCNND